MPARSPVPAPLLVTGGAGFIGHHLVRALARDGVPVRVLDDLSTGRAERLAGISGVELVQADVADEGACREAVRGMAGVVHLAALASVPASIADPLGTTRVNVHGTVALLEAARREGIRPFVLAASCAAYGDHDEEALHEALPPRPLSPYAASKLACEAYVACAARLHGMAAVSLRFFNVYGPAQDPRGPYAAAVPRFLERLLAGAAPEIYGDGCQSRDFVYVGDVCRAIQLALVAPSEAHGAVINIGTGRATSLLELLAVLRERTGSNVPARHLAPRPGDIRRSRADILRSNSLLGFRAETPLEEGLALTAAALRA